ncbi:histone deacetylase [Parasalinivibrio latis]|uniref:histone deacetylase family protein n=1 Tax=Parasalinivibrio latis TaxID=2952610 RepID=UPI0030E45EE8
MGNPLPLIYHPIYSDFPLPDGHRYPLQKYRMLKEYIESESQTRHAVKFITPEILDPQHLKSIHHAPYVDALLSGTLPLVKMRRIGFPWSEALITRSLTSLGGTLDTVQQAMENGVAVHLTGGYHHSHFDFGSGFCLFNDLILAATEALAYPGVDRVLIVDCDVHHGDGTAALAADNPRIITLSIHSEKNFPSRKPPSDIDIGLPNGADSESYLHHFCPMLKLALAQYQPDFVVYDAGVDIHTDDELGYLNVCSDGIYERDRFVLSQCREQGIPVAAVIGGGYRTEQEKLVPLHANLISAALAVMPFGANQ